MSNNKRDILRIASRSLPPISNSLNIGALFLQHYVVPVTESAEVF
jgi:hypothetical protein